MLNLVLKGRCAFAVSVVWMAYHHVALDGFADDQRADHHLADAKGVEYFETHIRPLLAKRCYSCHSAEADKREGDLTLDSKSGWQRGGDQGAAIVPGDVQASLLLQAVRYEGDLQMPPNQRLSDEAIEMLNHWVRIGAPDPRDNSAIEVQPTINAADPIAGRNHWAFQPLAESAIPPVADSNWANSNIDRFILAKLQAENLHPVEDADRREFARRVYFQLIGLPPTTAELNAFLQDERPDAYERLVDGLLESPHFGERWGRHWLDLARYADSNGLDENFLFREAWRYRNWVIDAINSDMPYPRFVTEQIAGDLLPFEQIEQRDHQRIAAGFLVVGPKVLLGNDPKKQRMEVADEQLDTIGRTFLGQTLGCARCHDHKFDPIPTADYYALAGILTSTNVMERRHMLGQQRVMERLVGLGAKGNEQDDAYEAYWRARPQLKQKQQNAKSAMKLLEKGDEDGFTNFAAKHREAVAADAIDSKKSTPERLAAQQKLIQELDQAMAHPPSIPARAMIPGDRDQPMDEAIRLAGQFDRPGDQIPRGFLQVIGNGGYSIPTGGSGRLELAAWLTDVEHGAGRLAARVLANRIWRHLMGRGIVRTVDNFGRTGESPTHPDLLDYLAHRLIESNWSIKQLIREIVLTRTFALSSRDDDSNHDIDPENLWMWRANRRRLDPESLRDAMLMAAAKLDVRPMDSSVWYLGDQATAVGANKNRRRTDFPNRSVYLPVIRNDLPEVFDVFDFADPHATTGMRPSTMVATQGLYFLNDELVLAASRSIAQRLFRCDETSEVDQRVSMMFRLILGVDATQQEQATTRSFIAAVKTKLVAAGQDDAELQAWAMACHALLASSRFQILN